MGNLKSHRETIPDALPGVLHKFLVRLCLEGFLPCVRKGPGNGNRPGRFPLASAPRFPQLRPLSLALFISY
eukprot:2405670-Pyramimonas_sp.AAC.1